MQKKFVIIRGPQNGGKTLTAAMVYEKLSEDATPIKLLEPNFNELSSIYIQSDIIRDFIAFNSIADVLVIIISPGDVAVDLQYILDRLEDTFYLKQLIGDISYTMVIIVCCARSINRIGSAYRMLTERVDAADRMEVWTLTSEKPEEKKTIKEGKVASIIQTIKSYIGNSQSVL
jgi:hypothetical protein